MERQGKHKLVWYENESGPAAVAWGTGYVVQDGILFFQTNDLREIVLSPSVKYVVK